MRQRLLLNAVPLYEDRGYLKVKFPRVTASAASEGTVNVQVTVDEGLVYRLALADLTGAPGRETPDRQDRQMVDHQSRSGTDRGHLSQRGTSLRARCCSPDLSRP